MTAGQFRPVVREGPPCRILGESVSEVRVRIKPGWEMNLRKQLILAVEEDGIGLDSQTAMTNAIN